MQITRKRFTVEDYYRMAEAGILTEDDRVELIEGEIIEMSPIGFRHAACVDRLTRMFTEAVGRRAVVRVQNPVRIGRHSEPEPDVMLLAPRPDFYASGHPTPPDVLLLVEVMDTSTEHDRDVKLKLYARSGIAEVWLVDLERGAMDVHLQPSGETYANVATLDSKAAATPAAMPDLSFSVGQILGVVPL